jgi:uncharacterized membrane protein
MWALGASMIILSGLIWLPFRLILMLSLVIIVGHNFFDYFIPFSPHSFFGVIWLFLHTTPTSYLNFKIIYALIPWPGVMAFSYCLGTWFNEPTQIRNQRFFLLGVGCLILFMVLRYFNFYGDPNLWQSQSRGDLYTFLSFINVTKYPASLLYLLVTLGFVFLCWPLYEKWYGFGRPFLLCYGKVSLFYYLIHLPILHVGAIFYSTYFLHYPGGWWGGITPWNSLPWPPHYHASLLIVYIAWVLVVLITYPLCLIYKRYKSTHNYPWLSYL